MTKPIKTEKNKFKVVLKANSYALMQAAIRLTKQGIFLF
jgi:hypothetical protein